MNTSDRISSGQKLGGMFALVDCAQVPRGFYRNFRHFEKNRWKSLFDNTPDETFSMSGPVLLQVTPDGKDNMAAQLSSLEKNTPAVVWLWSHRNFETLFQLLQSILYVGMPSGKTALCRFYDSRCLKDYLQFVRGKNRETYELLKAIQVWAYWNGTEYVYLNEGQ
jgi:hypothetical protein